MIDVLASFLIAKNPPPCIYPLNDPRPEETAQAELRGECIRQYTSEQSLNWRQRGEAVNKPQYCEKFTRRFEIQLPWYTARRDEVVVSDTRYKNGVRDRRLTHRENEQYTRANCNN